MTGAEILFREVWVIGLPVAGYILLNIENNQIMGLFTNKQRVRLRKS